MSQGIERSDLPEPSVAESRVEALRRSPEFRGPVDPPDGHAHDHEEPNDHLASIYDGREEQFAAAIPFVRQGLERGERCLYVAAHNSPDEVLAAMREYGIDVDAALESGALSVHTPADTYLRGGEFDRDAMVEFWEDALDRAHDEGYAGIRAAAEMTWALGADADLDLLTEYEAVLNTVYPGEDYVVLCQYDRDRFPPEVVRDVVRTHPYLVSGDTVAHNLFYAPPDEYFGPDDPASEVDRMLETQWDRTEARVELEDRQRYLRQQYETAADAERTFDQKLQALLELGCERFDLELGGLARIDPETDLFEVEALSGDHEHLEPGAQVDLSETYCRVFTDGPDVAAVTDPLDEGFEDTTAYEEFGVRTYLGTRIELADDLDRTLFFVSSEPRDQPFSEAERTFHDLLGQWVGYELERRQREAQLQRKNDRLESFASMLAHELRNPLNIAQIYHQQAQPQNESAAEEVATALDRIEEMIDVLLVTARGSDSVIDWQDVSLSDAANEAWTVVDAEAAKLVVETDRTVRADPVHLRHVLENLFENSVEHGSETVTVRVGDLRDADGFYVADDGAGIPEDVRADAFDAGRTTAADGIGLGLTFVERLAETYGWDCTLTESEDGGARFEFAGVE